MSTLLIDDKVSVDVINKLISETTDYETCKKLSIKYYYEQPSCRPIIRTKMFDFCFENGIIIPERAHCYYLLGGNWEKGSMRREYLWDIFRGFGIESKIDAYNNKSDSDKRLYLLEETTKFFKRLNSYDTVKEAYLLLNDKFPELKDMMISVLFNRCFGKKGLIEGCASDFVTLFGKKHPFSKKMLNSFLIVSIREFVISAIIFAGCLLLILKVDIPAWTYIFIGAGVLAFGMRGLQFFIKIIYALCNYLKKTKFKFDTSVMAYTRKGHWDVIRTPINKSK